MSERGFVEHFATIEGGGGEARSPPGWLGPSHRARAHEGGVELAHHSVDEYQSGTRQTHVPPGAPVHTSHHHHHHSTSTQHHNHSSIQAPSSHLAHSSTNTHNAGSWDKWQFWDLETGLPCFWQAQGSLPASSDTILEEHELDNANITPDQYQCHDNDPFKVTPACTDLELLGESWSGQRSRFACIASSFCSAKMAIVGTLLLVVIVVGLVGVFAYTPLGAREMLEFQQYSRVDRLLKLHPRPQGHQLLIRYKHGAMEGEDLDWRGYVRQLDDLMEEYDLDKAISNPNLTDCSSVRATRHGPKHCMFDINHIDRECTKENNYGYDKRNPCVFLQFSPENHRDFIPVVGEGSDTVAVDCFGNTVIDQENMGSLIYTPDPGYKVVFFPAGPSPPYMAPLIAVQFVQPTVGVAIGVTCTIYTNQEASRPQLVATLNDTVQDPVDYLDKTQVHFNLLIE